MQLPEAGNHARVLPFLVFALSRVVNIVTVRFGRVLVGFLFFRLFVKPSRIEPT